jgi:hypothetical protein
MYRPKKTPQEIKHRLIPNLSTGLYDIEENGITYSMTLELTRRLKEDIVNVKNISDWYKDLDKFTRAEIIRTGNVPKVKDDFYPDYTPE